MSPDISRFLGFCFCASPLCVPRAWPARNGCPRAITRGGPAQTRRHERRPEQHDDTGQNILDGLISEIGVDMRCWPTEHHLASWLTLAPNNKISGGKLLGSRTQPSANRAAKILRLAAMALVRGDHALGAFYRRLAARTDKPTAMTATARKLALLVYRMLKYNMPYHHTSAAEYDTRQRTRILRGLRKRATSLGFELVEASTGLVV